MMSCLSCLSSRRRFMTPSRTLPVSVASRRSRTRSDVYPDADIDTPTSVCLNGAMGVYDQIKTAFQDIIAPELHAIRGDIRLLDQKIDALRTEFTVEIRRVDTRIEGVNTRIDGLDRELRTAIDIRERLAALEARRSS